MSAPVPLRLRPLEIGDVLDETFRLYRRNFLLLAGVSVGFSIPLAAVAGYGFAALYSAFIDQAASGNPTDLSTLAPALTAIGVGTLINFALLPLLYGSVSLAICEAALGRPVTLRKVLGGALRRYFHVAGYLALLLLMAIAFCLFPLWIWIAVGWAAVLPVMFVENTGLVDAMRRSWRLVQGQWWRTFFILLLVYLLNYVVSLALEAFLYLGQILLSIFLSQFVAFAIYEAGAIVVGGLTIPILQIALVLIYFDLRVRKEGLDLFQLAQRVSVPPPALA
ncbi:MAG TPA: glycerophosphoryl diester phosphodiesterase membrane domain-containing protein [Candidatus Dormibacteraeota bacterium]|nr:glycerophosphoryl diester phosphodiesterase membrane domain-containing protein [Candidatus Dormibacteraeota bacterium]